MGLLRTAARTAVISGTATAVSGRVARRQAQNFAAPAQQPTTSAPAQVASSNSDDSSAKLVELANLHQQGVLTDEEFAAAKAKVLGL
jgi:membrane protease subunit (stomatin/prohibitin family)